MSGHTPRGALKKRLQREEAAEAEAALMEEAAKTVQVAWRQHKSGGFVKMVMLALATSRARRPKALFIKARQHLRQARTRTRSRLA